MAPSHSAYVKIVCWHVRAHGCWGQVWWLVVPHAALWMTVVFDLSQVEERSKLNRQSSPALQHKVSNRISDPSLPPRSESFSSGGMQPARTPPIHRSIEPQVCVCASVKGRTWECLVRFLVTSVPKQLITDLLAPCTTNSFQSSYLWISLCSFLVLLYFLYSLPLPDFSLLSFSTFWIFICLCHLLLISHTGSLYLYLSVHPPSSSFPSFFFPLTYTSTSCHAPNLSPSSVPLSLSLCLYPFPSYRWPTWFRWRPTQAPCLALSLCRTRRAQLSARASVWAPLGPRCQGRTRTPLLTPRDLRYASQAGKNGIGTETGTGTGPPGWERRTCHPRLENYKQKWSCGILLDLNYTVCWGEKNPPSKNLNKMKIKFTLMRVQTDMMWNKSPV